jgi:NAD(P)-dependent dehydrogenase (short-subunit alcohol dehydrogenase family)
MLLKNKVALIHGGGGSVGGAVARVFAREGAQVFLSGRTLSTLDVVAKEISAAGGTAETAQVDALNEREVDEYTDAVAERGGRIDIVFNAVGFATIVQGVPLLELSAEDFALPVRSLPMTNFLTARAAARHMVARGAGVILTMSATPARLPGTLMGGFGVALAGVEALSRHLAGELGPRGIRVICLRANAMPEAQPGMTAEVVAQLAGGTLLGRLPTLAETAEVAAFMASDRANAMTGTVANLSCGNVVD